MRIARLAVALGLSLLVQALAVEAQEAAGTADYAREKKWADEIAPGVVVGDVVYLETSAHRRFLGIYAGAPSPRAAVVLAHGLGVHPDWGLIGVLRSELPDSGYTTLSVQMPILAGSATGDDYPPTFPEAAERLAAALAFLQARGYPTAGIVSHSMGSRMTSAYLARHPGSPVGAWVAIGLSGPFEAAERLTFPILDLFGELDLPAVLGSVPERAAAMQSAPGYRRVRAVGADHFFSGRHAALVRHVREFLDHALAP